MKKGKNLGDRIGWPVEKALTKEIKELFTPAFKDFLAWWGGRLTDKEYWRRKKERGEISEKEYQEILGEVEIIEKVEKDLREGKISEEEFKKILEKIQKIRRAEKDFKEGRISQTELQKILKENKIEEIKKYFEGP